jgi:hypothetical protein
VFTSFILASYSQFGEPPRDLSDRYQFEFFRVCPWDLFAARDGDWKKKTSPEEMKRIREFLAADPPVIRLAADEWDLFQNRRKEWDEATDTELLWLREIDKLREIPPRARLDLALRCYYRGVAVENPVRACFRTKAIAALGDALAARWPDPDERIHYQYLRAELIRQSGNNGEAVAEFGKTIALCDNSPAIGEETSAAAGLKAWCRERLALIEGEGKTAPQLLAEVIANPPNPWRDKARMKDIPPEKFSRHQLALQQLRANAAKGDRPSADGLWDLCGMDNGRLIALAETDVEGLFELEQTDPRWGKWRAKLLAELETCLGKEPLAKRLPGVTEKDLGPIPAGAQVPVNQERNLNILLGECAAGSFAKREELRLAVESLRQPAPPGGRPPAALDDFLRKAHTVLDDGAPEQRRLAADAMLGELRQMGDTQAFVSWPLSFSLPRMYDLREELRGTISNHLEKPWKEEFWKLAVRYLLEPQAAGPALATHPWLENKTDKYGYGYRELLWRLFKHTHDPVLADRCVAILRTDDWFPSDIIAYAFAINTPACRDALMDRLHRIRAGTMKEMEELKNHFQHEAAQIESGIQRERMQRIRFEKAG